MKTVLKTQIVIIFLMIAAIGSTVAVTSLPASKPGTKSSDSKALEAAPTNPILDKTPVLFVHGFGGTKTRRLLYTKGYAKFLSLFYPEQSFAHTSNSYLFDRDLHRISSFNFNDVQVDMGIFGSLPNPFNANLAQVDDIDTLHTNLDKMPKDKPIIGFGVSRGAATWITTLGSKIITNDLACVILESPFSTTKNVSLYSLIGSCLNFLHTIIPSFNRQKTNDNIFQNIFPKHNLSGIQPIDVVGMISKDIPILLVHSEQDAIIPINQSRELYIRLRETGHEKVYFLEVNQGDHASLIWGPQSALYCSVVHALYKKYNLPYNPEFAGNIELEEFQPSVQDVQARIDATDSITKIPEDSQPEEENFFSTCLNIFM